MNHLMHVGWLSDLTQWLWQLVNAIWQAFVDFVDDLFVTVLEKSLAVVVYVLNLISVPDFMRDHSIGSLLGEAGDTILWLVHILRIDESLMVIGIGMSFYVMRRILTLGIW